MAKTIVRVHTHTHTGNLENKKMNKAKNISIYINVYKTEQLIK